MYVIFEGLDKSGKTTLEWELLKATNFKHIVIDRGPIGYMVFDKLLNRETPIGDAEFMRMADDINNTNNFIVIYCHCSKNVADNRLAETNHEELKYDYNFAQNILKYNIYKYYNNIIDVNTDNTIDDCIKYIMNKCCKFK